MQAIKILKSLDDQRRTIPPKIKTWKLSKETKFPGACTDVRIKLFFLEAPLSMIGAAANRASFMTPDYVDVNALHCALGFQYEGSEKIEFAVDLIAETFNINVLLPDVVGNDLVWKNKSIITFYSAIDRTYWSKSTFVGIIDGHLMHRLHEWIFSGPGGGYYGRNYMYIFFNITQMIDNEPVALTRRTVCDSFADEAIDMFKRNGAAIEFITPIHTAFTPIFVKNFQTDVSVLDPNNPKDWAVIFLFFKTLSEIFAILAGKLISGVNASIQNIRDPEFLQNSLNLISNDYFTMAKVMSVALGQMMQNSSSLFMILYSYDNATGSPAYYKIQKPVIFLNYIVSDITRNIVGRTFHGRKFYDEYTDGTSKRPRARALAELLMLPSESMPKALPLPTGTMSSAPMELGSAPSSSETDYRKNLYKDDENGGSSSFFYFLLLVLIIILVCWALGLRR